MKFLPTAFKIVLLAIVSLPVLLAGCQTVQFHEKERFADRIMAFGYDSERVAMRDHMITPREGSIGGFSSVNAGGCSCK